MRYLGNTRAAAPAALGLATLLSVAVAGPAAAQINVEVNGDRVNFTDARPLQVGGRVYIPLRDVARSLNANVTWDAQTRTVHGTRDGRSFALPIGSRTAYVQGDATHLDAPARIVSGRTMVPLRFAAEALGAQVAWIPEMRTVAISADGEIVAGEREEVNRVVVPAQTVIRAQLVESLSSESSRVGDRFTATVDRNDRSRFPAGTRFEGRVTEVRAATKNEPGILDVAFDRAILPDGTSVNISGSLASLDNNSVRQAADGRLVARRQGTNSFDWKWVGYGAGAGAILGGILGDDDWLKGALLGGIGGAIYGYINRGRNQEYPNVNLGEGAEFGILLNQRVTFNDRGF